MASHIPLLVVVRWNWKTKAPLDFNWGSAGASNSDQYAKALVDTILVRAKSAGKAFHVVEYLVNNSKELKVLAQKHNSSNLQKGSIGLYFLWPTQFRDGPNQQTACSPGGCVEAEALFMLIRTFERLGIRTIFPHHSSLYYQLISKSWVVELCGNKDYSIPPTICVSKKDIEENALQAAQYAIEKLEKLAQNTTDERAFKQLELVCKLGFSWEALDVRVTNSDSASLAYTMSLLLKQNSCYASKVYVQKRLDACFELRFFVIHGIVKYNYCARYETCIAGSGQFCNWKSLEKHDVIAQWLKGDEKAYEDAIAKAKNLVSIWNLWLYEFEAKIQAAIRMDFLVCHSGAAQASVYTLELTELGFSLWNWDKGSEVVFDAVALDAVS